MALSSGIEKLQKYLESAKSGLSTGAKVQIVIGNEAADLDSMASAVLYAYYKSQASPAGAASYVPLINIPRADFKLRTEAAFLFSHAGVKTESLLFAEDVDLPALHAAGKLELVLIDHNKLASVQAPLENAVVEIIDHHKDEGLYTNISNRIIEPVGSAATLVAEALLKNESVLEQGSATLLLGTILLDTVNLDPEAQRATEKDQKIVDTLLSLTGANRQELFDKLQEEKFNVSSLDSSDLLRKDYKEWMLGQKNVGFSSVLLSVADWLKKDSALSSSLGDYAKARKLDVLIAMNAYTDPQFTRELVVYCQDDALRTKLLGFLEASDLGLTKLEGSVDGATALYAQANLGYSRKKLQPVMNDFFTSL